MRESWVAVESSTERFHRPCRAPSCEGAIPNAAFAALSNSRQAAATKCAGYELLAGRRQNLRCEQSCSCLGPPAKLPGSFDRCRSTTTRSPPGFRRSKFSGTLRILEGRSDRNGGHSTRLARVFVLHWWRQQTGESRRIACQWKPKISLGNGGAGF